MPSDKQIGVLGEREPELCAVSGRPVRGKHAVTHYKGDNVHYVRVLNQFEHLWKEAAPAYGFPEPVIEDERTPVVDSDVFVLDESLNESINVYDAATGKVVSTFLANSDNYPSAQSTTDAPSARPSKKAAASDSKGDD